MNTQVTKLFRLILVGLIFSLGISQTPFAAEQFSGVKYKTVSIDTFAAVVSAQRAYPKTSRVWSKLDKSKWLLTYCRLYPCGYQDTA